MGMLYEYARDEREIMTGQREDSMHKRHGIDGSIRWYLAGPMTGIKGFNYAYFDTVAARLRADGYNVVSPAELESPEARRVSESSPDGSIESMPAGSTWGKALARCMPSIVDQCGGIILLPEWWKYKGARVEAIVGLACRKQFGVWGRYTESAVTISNYAVALRLREWLSEIVDTKYSRY